MKYPKNSIVQIKGQKAKFKEGTIVVSDDFKTAYDVMPDGSWRKRKEGSFKCK